VERRQPTTVGATKIQLHQSPTFSKAGLSTVCITLTAKYERLKRAE
jgi:hypothetical protein